MRPVTLELHVLVRTPANDNPWPGDATTINFNDAACPSIEGDNPQFIVEQGFVVMDYDASASDSQPAPEGWQYFSQGEAGALIPQWVANNLEWHAATKIYCSNNQSNFWIVSESSFDVMAAFGTCCATAPIPTQALALKNSAEPLTPDGPNPRCHTPAEFIWVALLGAGDDRNLLHTFSMWLYTPDMSTALSVEFPGHNSEPLTASTTFKMKWPEDFIGQTFSGVTIIPNDQVPGPDEMQVQDFDNGIIGVYSTIFDADTSQVVSEQTPQFKLPGTLCPGQHCKTPTLLWNGSNQELPYYILGQEYENAGQISGDAPFAMTVNSKPAWMTISLNENTGVVTIGGVANDVDSTPVDIDFENCGAEEQNFTQVLAPQFDNYIMFFQAFISEPGTLIGMELEVDGETDIFVDWGDGSPIEKITLDDGVNNFTHNYVEADQYNVNVYCLTAGQIRVIKMENWPLRNTVDLIGASLTGLTEIVITDCSIRGLSGGAVAPFINLSNNNLQGTFQLRDGMEILVVNGNPNLLGFEGNPDVAPSLQALNAINCGLTDVGMYYFNDNGGWPCPNLVTLLIGGNASLTDMGLRNYLPLSVQSFSITGNAATLAEVNGALERLASGSVIDGNFNSTGTVAPTGAGLTAKATLLSRDWSVNTD